MFLDGIQTQVVEQAVPPYAFGVISLRVDHLVPRIGEQLDLQPDVLVQTKVPGDRWYQRYNVTTILHPNVLKFFRPFKQLYHNIGGEIKTRKQGDP